MATRDDVLREAVATIKALGLRVDALEHRLAEGGDPWDAEFGSDAGGAPSEAGPHGSVGSTPASPARVAAYTKGPEGGISFAPPTREQAEVREKVFEKIGWENWSPTVDREGNSVIVLDEATARHAFYAGGPMWLYFYDREFFMQQLPNVIAAMVHDVNSADPETAAELSADVMKDRGTGNTDVAYEAFNDDVRAGRAA